MLLIIPEIGHSPSILIGFKLRVINPKGGGEMTVKSNWGINVILKIKSLISPFEGF